VVVVLAIVMVLVVVVVAAALTAVILLVVIREQVSPSRYTDLSYALEYLGFGCQAVREISLFFQTPRPS